MNLIFLTKLENLARAEARKFQHPYIRSEHLLLALAQMTNQAELNYAELAEAVGQLAYPTCGAEEKLIFAEGAKRAIAYAQALEGDSDLLPEHLLAGIRKYSPIARNMLSHRKGAENTEKILKSYE